ncbi:MAG: bifunctional diaminohydroxyphosphoribosylaminopyrimidine deaminase/5-amino-6-(5-phosphoribosylamino)uracil reductase RibD [Alphaproteobacteria bacterium]|nr:bifunctional diaminohydroxyphosphoribosylaminopyrimidine deaminase/5-amino-6-(5-phosphoribosylamino)uracil reductase RibD [Alphaproteobacteria bacterium]
MGDAAWMQRCLALARQAEGRTAPNPMVGAVVVRDGEVLAEGWHVAAGQDHAETAALRKLDFQAEGATLYVNLEPCCHHGRTPPCTGFILQSGVRRVVVGGVDPNPVVGGKGLDILRQAGLEVVVGVEREACEALNAPYIKATETGLPWVEAKAGITLDGRIADEAGHSRWITSEAARAEGRRMRDRLDAILVGSGTLLGDDPSLNTRLPGGRDPLPVILDTELRCPEDAKVLSAGRRPLLICAEDAPERALPADVLRVPRTAQGVDLEAAMRGLVARGVTSVLLEGGGRVLRSALDAGLVDRLVLFVAPKLLAGGTPFVAGPGYALPEAPGFTLDAAERVGEDLKLVLTPRRGGR